MTTALVPMSEIEKMAKVVVSSRLFGVESIEQAMTLMLLCQAENVHPMIALRDYHIVEGKPALKADAMLARFQAGGGIVEWKEYTDTKVSAYFSHPASPKPVLIEWSIAAADKVSVWSKKKGGWEPITARHTWKSYPRQMLKARVISEGVRATNPGVAVGIYTVEETQDFSPPREKIISPSDGVEGQLTIEETAKVDEVAAKMIEWLIIKDSVGDAVCEMDNAALNAEQTIYLWTHFDSKQRAAMKKEQAAAKAKRALPPPANAHTPASANVADLISDAQHKRLEARIGELKLDREAVKKYVFEQTGKEHFTDLTKDEYAQLDAVLDKKSAKQVKEFAADYDSANQV